MTRRSHEPGHPGQGAHQKGSAPMNNESAASSRWQAVGRTRPLGGQRVGGGLARAPPEVEARERGRHGVECCELLLLLPSLSLSLSLFSWMDGEDGEPVNNGGGPVWSNRAGACVPIPPIPDKM
jgi:hypothetical protein